MDETIHYRQAVESDYEQLCDLEAELDSLHIGNLPQLFQSYAGRSREKAFFFSPPGDFQVATFVAEQKSRLLGFVCLGTRVSAPIPLLVPRKFAVVDSLYVTPAARRLGIVARLISMAEDWSKHIGCSAIELNVYAFNQSALEFYHAVGFEDLSHKLIRTLD
jgi:ribosomal protein S18 acetylase RimI-like enzyme